MIRLKLSHSKWKSHNLIVKCPTLSLARRWHRDWEPPLPTTRHSHPRAQLRDSQGSGPNGMRDPLFQNEEFQTGNRTGTCRAWGPAWPQPAPPSRRPSYYAASSVHASFNDFLRDAPRPHVSFWHLVTAYTLPLFANNNIYPKALITELQQNKLISFAVFYIKRTRFVQLRRFHMNLAPCTWIHIKLCK